MTIQKLYTGGGVSLSPVNAEGRKPSQYVRLIADEGMAITNGSTVTTCADVPAAEIGNWTDCEAPFEEEATEADYIAALNEMGVKL